MIRTLRSAFASPGLPAPDQMSWFHFNECRLKHTLRGLYVAARYNAVMFGNIKDPFSVSSTFGKAIPWDRDVQRYEVVLGYKAARGILIKLGYQWTKVDVNPRPQLDVVGSQISVSF